MKMQTILRYCVAIGMVLFLTITGLATPAQAFNQSDVDTLLSTKVCPNCDLSGANLNGKNLDNANLQGANLQGATAVQARLNSVNLQGANLQGANVSNSGLVYANLKNANLQDTNLSATYLEHANLTGATGTTWQQLYSAYFYELTAPSGRFISD